MSKIISKLRMMNFFAQNLKYLRLERNLTQPELARSLHVSNGMISFWENGKYEPTASSIITVAQYFGVSIDELLTTKMM